MGNPLDMPIDLYLILIDRISYIRTIADGSGMGDREFVDFSAEISQFKD